MENVYKCLEVDTHPWYVSFFKADAMRSPADVTWCLEKNVWHTTHQKNPCGI
jgi:hypothetical protein